MSNICDNCNVNVGKTAKFCNNCGSALTYSIETLDSFDSDFEGTGAPPEIIDVESSVTRGLGVHYVCFVTGIILMITYFVSAGKIFPDGVHVLLYALNIFAPGASGVQMTLVEVGGVIVALLTIVHFVILIYVLVMVFKGRANFQNPIVLVNCVWAIATFLGIAIIVLIELFAFKRTAEENRAARIINKAMKMK